MESALKLPRSPDPWLTMVPQATPQLSQMCLRVSRWVWDVSDSEPFLCGTFQTGNCLAIWNSCSLPFPSSWITDSSRAEAALVCIPLSVASDACCCLCPLPVCIADVVSQEVFIGHPGARAYDRYKHFSSSTYSFQECYWSSTRPSRWTLMGQREAKQPCYLLPHFWPHSFARQASLSTFINAAQTGWEGFQKHTTDLEVRESGISSPCSTLLLLLAGWGRR